MTDGVYTGDDYRFGEPPPLSEHERRVARRLLEDLERPGSPTFGGMLPTEKRSARVVSEAQIAVVIRSLEIALDESR